MGRKSLGENARSIMLRIRVSPSEEAELNRAAESVGEGTSTWARGILLREAGKISGPKKSAKRKA